MRDEMNRNTYADLVHKQYEKMDPVDPMTDIPEDELQNVDTYTSQSLSSEKADHSGFSQHEAGPADAHPDKDLHPDSSALEAWRATGADPDNRTLGEEPDAVDSDRRISADYEGKNGIEAETTGKLPLDHVAADTAFSLGTEANETYPRRNPVYNPAYSEDAEATNEQSSEDEAWLQAESAQEEPPLEDIPDADEIQAGSPVDPAAPTGTDQHGIDVLNGVGGMDDETGRKLPENF